MNQNPTKDINTKAKIPRLNLTLSTLSMLYASIKVCTCICMDICACVPVCMLAQMITYWSHQPTVRTHTVLLLYRISWIYELVFSKVVIRTQGSYVVCLYPLCHRLQLKLKPNPFLLFQHSICKPQWPKHSVIQPCNLQKTLDYLPF